MQSRFHGELARPWARAATRILAATWLVVAAVIQPSAAQEVNACAVLSAADIQATLGIAVNGTGSAVDIGVRHSCDWKYGSGANLRLAVFTSPNAQTLDMYTSGPKAWHPLSGLGQRAGYRQYDFAAGITSEEVQVVLATRAFFVQTTGHADQMPAKEALIALARTVVKRLP